MSKSIIKFKLGDVVQLNKFWDKRIGIVQADENAWYCTKDRWSIANCICKASDVVKIIKKNVVPKKLLKYVN